jgi:hypothetical protein
MRDAPLDYRPSILDTSNIKTLHRYRRLLNDAQRELLSIVRCREAKSMYLQRQVAKENYLLRTQPDDHARWSQLARLGIALMSTWERRRQFVYCGHGNRVNKRGLCHIYRYCLTCNNAFRAKPLIEEFANEAAFYRASWMFVTVSFTTNPANAGCFFSPDAGDHFDVTKPNCIYEILGQYDACPTRINDLDDLDRHEYDPEVITACWNAGHDATKTLKRDKRFTGYLGSDDLAMRFNTTIHNGIFCECAGLGHTHHLITKSPGETFGIEDVEEIEKEATSSLQRAYPGIHLYVSVKGFVVLDAETLARLLRYVIKPLNVAEPYGWAVKSDEAKDHNGDFIPDFMASLNTGVDYLFDALENGIFEGRRGLRRGGVLVRGKNTGYIGSRPPAKRTKGKRSKGMSKAQMAKLKASQERIIDDPDYEF